ncbi:MAG TPA: CmcI family methyltransferase [Terriglobia bacterium]|nr:CmcI family methyltransferase [Terriglobia bacterium]
MKDTSPDSSKITLTSNGESRTVDLYSQEGVDLVANLWLKLSAEYRLMYEPTWLGIPIIQLPDDIVMMQELIWKIRPDYIVECGVAHGGSAILYASICELLGRGRVIGVDVEIRKYNRVAIQSHPLSRRIELIEGSSVDSQVVDDVKRRTRGAQSVLVVLDSNHSREHVRKELEMYCEFVTPGSYLVAMDGAQSQVWDIPRGKKEWKDDNPLPAIRDFLSSHPEFQSDSSYTRMHVTSNPEGFLRRLSPGERNGL